MTERLFAPLDEPAFVAVLEVDAVRPIEVIARFRPDLQLAWPAGFGGQYVGGGPAAAATGSRGAPSGLKLASQRSVRVTVQP